MRKVSVYDESFRAKVVGFIEKGHTYKEASELFGVSMKTLFNWKRRIKEGKGLKYERVPRSPHRTNYEALRAYVKEHPDAYLREIFAHFSVPISTIWLALKRLGIKYKKTKNLSRIRSEKTGRIYRISKKAQ